MLEKRHSVTVLFFIVLTVSVIGFSLLDLGELNQFDQVGEDESSHEANQDSFFKSIDYYSTRHGKKLLQLTASELLMNSYTQKTIFFNPDGRAYSSGPDPFFYKGKKGLLNQKLNFLTIEDEVEIKSGESKVLSDKVVYKIDKDEVTSTGNVRSSSFSAKNGDSIFINSDRALSWPKSNKSEFVGNVRGKVIRKRVYEESVTFDSSKLYLDLDAQYIKIQDDVTFKKQRLTANSSWGEIYLENYNKNLKYFVLYDDVKVVEDVVVEKGTPYKRRAYAEKLEGIISEDKIILTGYPKVYQLKDVIKGNKIILRENNEIVEVDDANTNFILR